MELFGLKEQNLLGQLLYIDDLHSKGTGQLVGKLGVNSRHLPVFEQPRSSRGAPVLRNPPPYWGCIAKYAAKC